MDTSTSRAVHKQAAKGAISITQHLKPLKGKKSPAAAALFGFLFGGIGLGLFFESWLDFFLPVVLWILCIIVAPPTAGLAVLAAPLFAAAYGYSRAKHSNAKLDAEQADGSTVIDCEPLREINSTAKRIS